MCLEAVVLPQSAVHGELQVTTSLLSLLDAALPPGGRTRKAKGRRGFRCAELPRCRSRSSSVRVQLKDRHEGRCFVFFHFSMVFPRRQMATMATSRGRVTVWLCVAFYAFHGPAACQRLVVSRQSSRCRRFAAGKASEVRRWPMMAMMAMMAMGGLSPGFSFSGPKVELISVDKCS